jgi:ribosomal protein S6--L-glutamate ligase
MARTLSRMARIEKVELTETLKNAAEAAAHLTELEVCAVDLLELRKDGGDQARIFEVNASPSLPEMEAATGVDLATAIVERAEVMYRELHGPNAG